MYQFIPFNQDIDNKLSTSELITEFTNPNSKYIKINLYAIMAKRLGEVEQNKIEEELMRDIVSESNRREVFFGSIKWAWIPILAILEYGNEENKKLLDAFLRTNWTISEYTNLKEYLRSDKIFSSYFNP
jgi:hypothetical protein